MYQERLLFVNEHVSVYRSYFTQHVIQYQRRLTSMINQASTTRCTRIYVNNSLSWKNILYMESQINNPSFVFLTFVSTSVHVLLEVHYVTIQIRPVLYMLLTNLGFIRKITKCINRIFSILNITLHIVSTITLHMILYVNY